MACMYIYSVHAASAIKLYINNHVDVHAIFMQVSRIAFVWSDHVLIQGQERGLSVRGAVHGGIVPVLV